MIYVTDDGKKFNNIDDAKVHEEELISEKTKKAELELEKQKRRDEIDTLSKKLKEMKEKYCEDFYPNEYKSIRDFEKNDLFGRLFRTLLV